MIELIFVIVIIGILASVAVPKFLGVKDSAKKSAELATVSAVNTALDSAHGEWSINEGSFTWGRSRSSSEINDTTGFPKDLGSDSDHPFNYIIKDNEANGFKKVYLGDGFDIYTGPASNAQNGVKYPTDAPGNDINGKPDKNDFWIYAYAKDNCKVNCTNCNPKTLHYGDFVLIDVNGTTPTNYNSITCN